MKKKARVSIRIDEDLRDDFARALEMTGMGETQFVIAAIKALLEYVGEHQEITLPIAIIPKSRVRPVSRDSPPSGLNEEPGTFERQKTPNKNHPK